MWFSPDTNNFVLISHFCSFCREGRYLLIMTENFAALPRVKQILSEEDSEEPYVIFGSGFPKDQLFTQVKCCFLAFCDYDVCLSICLYLSLSVCISFCLYVRSFLHLFISSPYYGGNIFLICNCKFHRFAATSTVSRSVWKPAEQ